MVADHERGPVLAQQFVDLALEPALVPELEAVAPLGQLRERLGDQSDVRLEVGGELPHDRAEPVELTEQELARYAGEYESIALRCRVTVADGGLIVEPVADPNVADAGEEVAAGLPALRIGILPLPGDRYVVTDGPVKGMKGCFSRGADGEIDALNAGGRLLTRVR
jgi:hypothetical protein